MIFWWIIGSVVTAYYLRHCWNGFVDSFINTLMITIGGILGPFALIFLFLEWYENEQTGNH